MCFRPAHSAKSCPAARTDTPSFRPAPGSETSSFQTRFAPQCLIPAMFLLSGGVDKLAVWLDQVQGEVELDRGLDRPVDRAEAGMVLERALHLVAVGVRVEPQAVRDLDPAQHEHAVVVEDEAAALADQSTLARRNLTRLQRASEGARESADRGRD